MNEELTSRIIGAAISVHRELGPGLLESTYEACLAIELETLGIAFRRQASLPIRYRDHLIEEAYRLDFLIAERVILELKSVEALLPVHTAQVLTYLRLSKLKLGLLLNFNVPVLKDGIKRIIL